MSCLLGKQLPTQYYTAVLYAVTTVILSLQAVYYDHIYPRLKSNKRRQEEWKCIMEMALKMFNMSIGKRGRYNLLWEIIKCQQQPDGSQCGFYVMRYMKDIIDNYGSDNTIALPFLFSEGFYSKKEINEVRIEWAELVADYMVVDDDGEAN